MDKQAKGMRRAGATTVQCILGCFHCVTTELVLTYTIGKEKKGNERREGAGGFFFPMRVWHTGGQATGLTMAGCRKMSYCCDGVLSTCTDFRIVYM